jgi:DNA repair protein RadD
MQERAFQTAIIQEAREKLRVLRKTVKGRAPRLLIQSATGSGKTVTSARITQGLLASNKRVDFLAHRDFLIDQTAKTYHKFGMDYSFIASGRWYNPWPPVHLDMVQTLKSRLDRVTAPDYAHIDECHHSPAAGYVKIMDAWKDTTFFGWTATPCRLDGKGLDAYYDDIVTGPSVKWLIDSDYLADYVAYAPSSPDLTGLHVRMGDYVQNEVDEVMDKAVIIGDMVRDYKQYAAGLRAVYFCTSIAHSKHVAASFNAAGIPAMHLDGESSTLERREAALRMADGDLQVFTNVDLFGEGYDLSAQAERDVPIQCVGMARPTKSLSMFMQQAGRMLRPWGGKSVLLDHAGNMMAQGHGLPDDDRVWSLAGVEKRTSETVQCSGCGATVPAVTIVCRHCGVVLREAKKRAAPMGARQVEMKDGDLHEVDRDAIRKSKKLEEWQASSLDELIDIGKRRKYDWPEEWAARIWTSKQAKEDAREYARKQQMDFFEKAAIERVSR